MSQATTTFWAYPLVTLQFYWYMKNSIWVPVSILSQAQRGWHKERNICNRAAVSDGQENEGKESFNMNVLNLFSFYKFYVPKVTLYVPKVTLYVWMYISFFFQNIIFFKCFFGY